MELKSTIDIILKELADTRAIMEDLKQYPGVPILKVELAKAKCRSAEDVIRLLGDMDLRLPGKDQTPARNPEDESLPISENRTQSVTPQIEEQVKTVTEEPKIMDASEPGQVETEKEEKKSEEVSSASEEEVDTPGNNNKSADNKIVADKFHNSDTINEKMATNRKDHGITEVSKTMHINNLKDAIGINDSFFYVRELFGGNQELYGKTLEELNNSVSIESASEIVEKMTIDKANPDAVAEFMEIVKRKFS